MDNIRRQAIVEAAKKSFTIFGYKGTTMDQVAKMANVSKGSIYTFFTNKEELFDVIVQELIDEMEHVLQNAAGGVQSVFSSLHKSLYCVLEFREQHELMAKLYLEMREIGTPAAEEAILRVENRILAFIERQIQLAIDIGAMKPCDPQLTAFLFFKFYIALALEWSQRHEALDNEEISRLFQFYFVTGLAAR